MRFRGDARTCKTRPSILQLTGTSAPILFIEFLSLRPIPYPPSSTMQTVSHLDRFSTLKPARSFNRFRSTS